MYAVAALKTLKLTASVRVLENSSISRCCRAEDGKINVKKICNARTQPLFFSLDLVFDGVLVPVAVVVVLRSVL